MANFVATVKWQRNNEDFLSNKYSRAHTWEFDGGSVVAASASPHIVPSPWSVAENVDPEEAFVASISSCHMLFFLSIAAEQGVQVDSYTDIASGTMSRVAKGKHAISNVTLNPAVTYSGTVPNKEQQESLHHKAHEQCFIANSVNTEIAIEIQYV
ncbi:MAG: peroxiredoxin [SAR86 cluster bacterium]|uniref:Peroxiredoxin n=1 Tax=SAR86 cluster bacterium TaxID=2030880 RepID=A0A2A5B3A6_9GAMM|nr:MAG: peroxiredoxin [SAR86 cluster bacterium]